MLSLAPRTRALLLLLGAIAAEVVATSALKVLSRARWWPWVLVVGGYGLSFYLLTLVLQTLPLGVAYAIWSGVGTLFITLVGVWLYHDRLDGPAWVGIALIVVGVVLVHLFSHSAAGEP